MADLANIPPIASDHMLKYGRNVMVLGTTTLVLAYVPHINIRDFEPFGFGIKAEGEVWIWLLIGIVLFYYSLRFFVYFHIDRLKWKSYWPSKSEKTSQYYPHKKRLIL